MESHSRSIHLFPSVAIVPHQEAVHLHAFTYIEFACRVVNISLCMLALLFPGTSKMDVTLCPGLTLLRTCNC